jgi:hypothetical protein
MVVRSPDDFNQVIFTSPGATPIVYPYAAQLQGDGFYSAGFGGGALASFPFGTYSYVALNTNTGASESDIVSYTGNYFSPAPQLTASSYASIQGADATKPTEFQFNNIIEPVNNGPGKLRSNISLNVFDITAKKSTYLSGQLTISDTSLILPEGTLDAGHQYLYELLDNNVVDVLDGPVPSYHSFYSITYGTFSTVAGTEPLQTLINFQGGSPTDPTNLPVTGRIGQVTGDIGGAGATSFYQFFWSGGDFQSIMTLDGAPAGSEFSFELLDGNGSPLEELKLNQDDSYYGEIQQSLARGAYRVGVVSLGANDPSYTLKFVTPLNGTAAVPEASTWAMMIMGLGGVGAMARRRRSPFAQTDLGQRFAFNPAM